MKNQFTTIWKLELHKKMCIRCANGTEMSVCCWHV